MRQALTPPVASTVLASPVTGDRARCIRTLLKDAELALGFDIPTARVCLSRLLELLETEERSVRGSEQLSQSGEGLAVWQKRRIETYITEHINTPIMVRTLAGLIRVSPSHFTRVFKLSFGVTPNEHIKRQRIAHAQDMLRLTNEPISQVALSHGFSDQAHFSRIFQKIAGETPSRWRRLHQMEF